MVKYQAVVLNFDQQTVQIVPGAEKKSKTKALATASGSTPPRPSTGGTPS